ncbi:MAG: hypothetical protein AB7P14_29515 [Blastocatellales bacterium]
MEIEIADVSLNLVTVENRVEITVTTRLGDVIVFPNAQVETRSKTSAGESRNTIYAFAQKTEPFPFPKIYTFLLEDEEGCPPRHRLDESPI